MRKSRIMLVSPSKLNVRHKPLKKNAPRRTLYKPSAGTVYVYYTVNIK